MQHLRLAELNAKLWHDVERLFGQRGACGGCYCMHWRLHQGEDWQKIKGKVAKQRFKKLITTGKAYGILAYANDEPVGWCAMGPRLDFDRLNRATSLACDDPEKVWSLPCFFVRADYRGQKVATQLLQGAIKALKQRRVKIVEAYPVKPTRDGKPLPAAFAWTGTKTLFAKAGFKVVGNPTGAKQRVRKTLG